MTISASTVRTITQLRKEHEFEAEGRPLDFGLIARLMRVNRGRFQQFSGFIDGDRDAGFAVQITLLRQVTREKRRHGLEDLHRLTIRRLQERLGLPGTGSQSEREQQDEGRFHD